MFQNPAMLGLLQNKLDSLVGAPSDYIASLPAVVKKRLNALKNLQVIDAGRWKGEREGEVEGR